VIEHTRTGHRFRRVDPPDPAEFVAAAITRAPAELNVRVRFDAPKAMLETVVPPWVGTIDADGDNASILTCGADDPRYLAGHFVGTGIPFEVLDPPDLRDRIHALLRALAARLYSPA
jgi:hypothetical protein